MQGALKAAIDYIEVSVRAGTQAPMLATITEHRVQNLKLMLGRMPTDMDHGWYDNFDIDTLINNSVHPRTTFVIGAIDSR